MEKSVRLLLQVLCLGLTGCFSSLDKPLEVGEPPTLPAVIEIIRARAAEAKLANPLEVAAPTRAHPISSIPWIICVRSQTPDRPLNRTYALFFKGSSYVSFRMTAIVDHCEEQIFVPL
jgi:hypothetical protein